MQTQDKVVFEAIYAATLRSTCETTACGRTGADQLNTHGCLKGERGRKPTGGREEWEKERKEKGKEGKGREGMLMIMKLN